MGLVHTETVKDIKNRNEDNGRRVDEIPNFLTQGERTPWEILPA